jgi:serine/threonine-protein kinase TTK/MPS1
MTPIRSMTASHTIHKPAAAASGCVASTCATPGAVAGADVISVNGVPYSKLDTIGRGGTSQVFRVLSPDRKILALKQVKFDSDPGLLEAVVNEIELMKLLRERKLNQVIIELFDSEVKMEEETVYMVMECGEIDLAHMLHRQRGTERDGTLSESFICMYWQQMLTAVHAIHEARVIHADLKPANFLCVQGALKLIDFGIAKQSSADTTKIARDSQVGTVNYMSPESITCDVEDSSSDGQFKLGRASDVWSLGCILYQMVYGHTPFSHLRTIYQKLSAIPDATKPIAFPPMRNPCMIDVLRRCLQRQPTKRPSIPELLEHPLLRPELRARPASPAPAVVADEGVSLEALPQVIEEVCRALGGAGLDIAALRAEIARQQEAARAQGPEVKLEIAPLVAAAMAAAQRPPTHPPTATPTPHPRPTALPPLVPPPLAPPPLLPPHLAPSAGGLLPVARPTMRPAPMGVAGGTAMPNAASRPGASTEGAGGAMQRASAAELQEGLKRLQPVVRRTDQLTSASELQEGLKKLQPVSRRTDPCGASVADLPGIADVGNLQRAVEQAMAARRRAAWRDEDMTESTFS